MIQNLENKIRERDDRIAAQEAMRSETEAIIKETQMKDIAIGAMLNANQAILNANRAMLNEIFATLDYLKKQVSQLEQEIARRKQQRGGQHPAQQN